MQSLHPLLCCIPATLAGLISSSPLQAASHPYEFHADSKMQDRGGELIEKAYGYMNLVTDPIGGGVINVMFSNASQFNKARFNAQVKFLNTAGATIREEQFSCLMKSARAKEAFECKVSKPLKLSTFESIKVDFFLSHPK